MIGIASDHAGFETKQAVLKFLEEKGYEMHDFGTFSKESVDYSDYAIKVGEAVKNGQITTGVLICSTGTGMSIACNKVKSVRCAKVVTINEAKLAKEHNNANVIAIGADVDVELNKQLVLEFLESNFSNGERHIRRIEKITNYER